MSAKPILYSLDYSPPARTVAMVAKYIGLELDIQNVDLFNGEHLSEKYLKMNPQHTVPTLDDNGTYLWESAPICTYLIAKYAPNGTSELYPVEPSLRARIEQRLYFNASILFPLQRQCSVAVFFQKATVLPAELFDAVRDAFDLLERFLADGAFLVDDALTLADLAVAPLVQNMLEWTPLETGKRFERIAAWLQRVEAKVPFYAEQNASRVAEYGAAFRKALTQNQHAAQAAEELTAAAEKN